MTDELKVALQTIWEELLREHINKYSLGGGIHQVLSCLYGCGCQWWSLRASPVTAHLQGIINKLAFFSAISRLPVETTLGTLKNGGL